MKFYLPELDLTKCGKVWVGNRSRYATATAVSFLNENEIVVASFLGKKIYFIDLVTLTITKEIDTPYYVDLMDYKDGLIATANRADHERVGSISLFGKREITYEYQDMRQIHGIRIISEQRAVITSNSEKERGLFYVDLRDGKVIDKFNKFKLFPKDVFLLENRFLISSSNSKPQAGGPYKETYSILYLFDYGFNKITELEFEGQTDCIGMSGENGFITLQGQDKLLHFKLIGNTLKKEKRIGGFSFPHGVACLGNKIVVTNYGDNSIDILNINEL